jgi:hypothetical protein
MNMVQRLRARFGVPADLLLPPVGKAKGRHGKRKARTVKANGEEGGVRDLRCRVGQAKRAHHDQTLRVK